MTHNAWVRTAVILLFSSAVAVPWTAKAQTPPPQGTESAKADPKPAAHSLGYTANFKASNGTASSNYEIGIGDILAINVWKEEELSKTMPVRPDGKISLPVIGEMRVAGLTTGQLENQIVTLLGSYIREPQVNVIVEEVKSKTFNVMGKVMKGGSFDLTKPTTILEAIALAGGFQEYARLTKIYVLRPSASGTPSMMPFNYKAVIKGKNSGENILVQAGDTIVVP